MNIGIIGAGNIGSALATRFVQLGHDVAIANSRGPETLGEVAKATGALPLTASQAAHGRDLVVVTIPQRSVPDLPGDLLDGVSDEVVVVDTGNYYPQQRDGRIEAIETGTTESRWVAEQLGRPGTVKAFNNIQAAHLRDFGRPAGDPQRIALPYAGDEAPARATVAELIDALGFDAVDDGGLDDSWRQQPGTPCYGQNLGAGALREALAAVPPERPLEFRAAE